MPWAVLAKGEPAGEGRDPTPPCNTCLFNLENGRQRGELIAICSYLKKRSGAGLFPEIFSDSTRSDGHKLEHGKFLLGIRKQISPYG